MDLGSPRSEYGQRSLDVSDLSPDPIDQLRLWLDEAIAANVVEPSAMCLSTVGPLNRPSARMVLLRGLSERGLTFFTNYESRKGSELDLNPWACATFWWGGLERQVRIEGRISMLSAEESDAYFAARPRQSQLASAASPQSQAVANREELEGLVAQLAAQYPADVPRPEHWGGYVLTPDQFEFWQGRSARLHDRLAYLREDDAWRIARLAP